MSTKDVTCLNLNKADMVIPSKLGCEFASRFDQTKQLDE